MQLNANKQILITSMRAYTYIYIHVYSMSNYLFDAYPRTHFHVYNRIQSSILTLPLSTQIPFPMAFISYCIADNPDLILININISTAKPCHLICSSVGLVFYAQFNASKWHSIIFLHMNYIIDYLPWSIKINGICGKSLNLSCPILRHTDLILIPCDLVW